MTLEDDDKLKKELHELAGAQRERDRERAARQAFHRQISQFIEAMPAGQPRRFAFSIGNAWQFVVGRWEPLNWDELDNTMGILLPLLMEDQRYRAVELKYDRATSRWYCTLTPVEPPTPTIAVDDAALVPVIQRAFLAIKSTAP
jgi:hypothetical protein